MQQPPPHLFVVPDYLAPDPPSSLALRTHSGSACDTPSTSSSHRPTSPVPPELVVPPLRSGYDEIRSSPFLQLHSTYMFDWVMKARSHGINEELCRYTEQAALKISSSLPTPPVPSSPSSPLLVPTPSPSTVQPIALAAATDDEDIDMDFLRHLVSSANMNLNFVISTLNSLLQSLDDSHIYSLFNLEISEGGSFTASAIASDILQYCSRHLIDEYSISADKLHVEAGEKWNELKNVVDAWSNVYYKLHPLTRRISSEIGRIKNQIETCEVETREANKKRRDHIDQLRSQIKADADRLSATIRIMQEWLEQMRTLTETLTQIIQSIRIKIDPYKRDPLLGTLPPLTNLSLREKSMSNAGRNRQNESSAAASGNLHSSTAQDERASSEPPRSGIGTNILMQGWLTKRGGVIKSWRKRYFLLQANGMLLYYTDQECSKSKGIIDMNTALKVGRTFENREPRIYVAIPTRTYFFKSDTESTLNNWLDSFHKVQHNRSPIPTS